MYNRIITPPKTNHENIRDIRDSISSRTLIAWKTLQSNKKHPKQEENIALWKKILLVSNFPFKNGLDYELKQLSKEALQFTGAFTIYFIFKNIKICDAFHHLVPFAEF